MSPFYYSTSSEFFSKSIPKMLLRSVAASEGGWHSTEELGLGVAHQGCESQLQEALRKFLL